MIQISPQARIYLSVKPLDFRNGIDGIARQCQLVFQQDSKSGAYFAFRNRAGTSFKMLYYDGHGYWLCQRRLSQGKLKGWPQSEAEATEMDPRRFMALLWHAELMPQQSEPWRRLSAS